MITKPIIFPIIFPITSRACPVWWDFVVICRVFQIVGIITRHNLTHEYLMAKLRQHYITIWRPTAPHPPTPRGDLAPPTCCWLRPLHTCMSLHSYITIRRILTWVPAPVSMMTAHVLLCFHQRAVRLAELSGAALRCWRFFFSPISIKAKVK